jgi:hypothetical protein
MAVFDIFLSNFPEDFEAKALYILRQTEYPRLLTHEDLESLLSKKLKGNEIFSHELILILKRYSIYLTVRFKSYF